MPSNYTGDSAEFTDSIPLCVDSDAPSAQLFRTPVERVLDNTAYLNRTLRTNREQVCTVFDDFLHVDNAALTFGSPSTWHGDTPWRATQTSANAIILESVSGGTSNHGMLRISSTAGGSGVVLAKFAGSAGEGVRASSILSAKVSVRAFEVDAGMKFEFGFQDSSGGNGINVSNTAGASFVFDPAIGPNWIARTSLNAAASTSLTDTGVSVNEGPGEGAQKLEIVREQVSGSVVEWRFYINDNLVVTKNSGAGTFFLPGLNEFMQARIAAIVPDLTADNEYFEIDYASFEFDSSGR
jgi:hypothetical protein